MSLRTKKLLENQPGKNMLQVDKLYGKSLCFFQIRTHFMISEKKMLTSLDIGFCCWSCYVSKIRRIRKPIPLSFLKFLTYVSLKYEEGISGGTHY